MEATSRVQRVLFAEDVSTDYELVVRLLKRNGMDFVSECVDTEPEFRAMLSSFNPTLILSDYRMPTFDGMRALKIAQQEKPDVPFIILTGSMNEDVAVECMKNGADDYVIKQNLKRLLPSIKSAIEKKRLIIAEGDAHVKLLDSELKYRSLVDNSPNAIFLESNGKFKFINRRFVELFEYSLEELNQPDFDFFTLILPEIQGSIKENIAQSDVHTRGHLILDVDMVSKSGKIMNTEFSYTTFMLNKQLHKQGIIRDVSKKRKLEARNILLSRTVEQSPESIIITDEKSNIVYVNPIFEKRTGYSFKEALGENPRILQSGEQDKDFYNCMWDTLATGKIWSGEIRNKKKNGELYWESVKISPVYNALGKPEHYVAIKEDITQKKKTLTELKLAKEKAEESDRLKSAFLATMNHELRTPLNHIIGFSEVILDMTEDPEILEFLHIINQSGGNLLEIIEDIFDLAMVEQSEIKVRKNEVYIRDVFEELRNELIGTLNSSNKNEQIVSKFTINDDIKNHKIICDKPKLVQVASNILKNAVKYTNEGFISLELGLTQSKQLSISIEDSGIGIPEDKLEMIFEFFRQGDDSHTRIQGGVGIGLALSRKLTEAMHGSIVVKSDLGKGSLFQIEVPIGIIQSASPEISINSGIDNMPWLQSKCILIVEDDEVSLELIQTMLEPYNCEIFSAANGQDAIDILGIHSCVNLILMDLKMPVMDGFMATKIIRMTMSDIPIIALTAYAFEMDKDRALKAGCNDVITKPINKATLFASLKTFLS